MCFCFRGGCFQTIFLFHKQHHSSRVYLRPSNNFVWYFQFEKYFWMWWWQVMCCKVTALITVFLAPIIPVSGASLRHCWLRSADHRRQYRRTSGSRSRDSREDSDNNVFMKYRIRYLLNIYEGVCKLFNKANKKVLLFSLQHHEN